MRITTRFASQQRAWRQKAGSLVKALHEDDYGAMATEYILILALIVLPIALLFPSMMTMVKTYGTRMTSLMGLPFP